MKFAKELDENAVPEWKDKYLDYKQGKKKLKAVARAIRNVDAPADTSRKSTNKPRSPFASLRDTPVYSFLQRAQSEQLQPAQTQTSSRDSNTPLFQGRSRSEHGSPRLSQMGNHAADSGAPEARAINERSPLFQGGRQGGPKMARYGSIIGSPPKDDRATGIDGKMGMDHLKPAPSLELPEPALENAGRPSEESGGTEARDWDRRSSGVAPSEEVEPPQPPPTQLSHTGNAYEVTRPTDTPPPKPKGAQRYRSLFEPKRRNTTLFEGSRPFMRRMFSMAAASPGSLRATEQQRHVDVALEAYREVDFRQAEFFFFLDKEMSKIETFYKSKEDAAQERLKMLREQLHIMRYRRLEEVMATEQKHHLLHGHHGQSGNANGPPAQPNGNAPQPNKKAYRRAHPLKASFDLTREALDKIRTGHVGKTSQAMEQLGTPHPLQPARGLREQQDSPVHQDYTHRAPNDPPYRTARRKLKIALVEFYRGLELLKNYTLQNRTAFRKINKKFDKTAHKPGETLVGSGKGVGYMGEKVNKAHFVTSSTPDDLLQEVEDLYARYFERGNHKVAVGKLRAKMKGEGDYYGAVFRAGLLLAAGIVLGLQGLVDGSLRLHENHEPTQTSYLFQIYAGYFLMLLLVGLFCLDAAVFARYRVNYQFIFEFDTRHTLDWKQLCELPAWFAFLLGLMMWLNFSLVAGGEAMYVYWPVVLVGLSLILLCLPPPLFYFRSRGWFLESNFRILLAGLYPVEFRDFFLGDMFCSQTYAIGNMELFFCLYAQNWTDEPQCNSSNSRLMGFLQCLPGIWRLLQCFRRYHDSGLWTHLANGLKYTCTIVQYMSLSLWRIKKPSTGLEVFFILCAGTNSLYCIFWDLYYDWSLPMNPYSNPPLLRDTLAYRRHKWWYYVAIFLDPILRFNWIFYVIFKHETQHSSIISFLIGLSEVVRRGMWVVFRVENEHATNVGRYRAQRDPALPYEVVAPQQEVQEVDGAPPPPKLGPTGSLVPGAEEANALENTDVASHQFDGPPVSVAAPSPATMGDATRASTHDIEQGFIPPPATSGAETTAAGGRGTGTLRQRKPGQAQAGEGRSPVYAALKRVGTTMLAAHAMDYERRKPKGKEDGEKKVVGGTDDEDEDEDEEDEE